MSSQAIAGYNGVGYLSPDGGDTWVPIIEMKDVTIKRTTKQLDATSHSSGGHEDYINGVDGWTATVNALTIFSDASKADFESAYASKTKLKFRFDPAGTSSGKPRFEGYANIEDLEDKFPNLDLVEMTCSLRGLGTLDYLTQ
jgi:predicted secreted protein